MLPGRVGGRESLHATRQKKDVVIRPSSGFITLTSSSICPLCPCLQYGIRPCVQQSKQKARSFNIMSKVSSLTGESIPTSTFHRNGSDGGGFLRFDASYFPSEMSQEAVSAPPAGRGLPSEPPLTCTRNPLRRALLPRPHSNTPHHPSSRWLHSDPLPVIQTAGRD